MDSAEVKLLTEQLGRMVDSINARLNTIEVELKHQQELDTEKINAIRKDLTALNKITDDHETRLRSATDGVTQFKVWSGLGGFSSIFSILSVVKSLFIP
jgi:hypothetical protein